MVAIIGFGFMSCEQDCPDCNGSGKCPQCDGTGKHTTWMGDECISCSGNGKCYRCDGSGKAY